MIQKNILYFLVGVLSCVTISASAQQRKRTDFDDHWKFAFGNAKDPLKDFNYNISTIFSKTGAAQHTAIDPTFNDHMIKQGVQFDVIGLSYYPKWHNTLADLQYNLDDLSRRYNKDVIVVEYSPAKREMNELSFNVADSRGKGSCIWEPLNTWEQFFDKDGKANELLLLYDEMSRKYLK